MESESAGAGLGMWLENTPEGLRMYTCPQWGVFLQDHWFLKVVPSAMVEDGSALAPGCGDEVTAPTARLGMTTQGPTGWG